MQHLLRNVSEKNKEAVAQFKMGSRNFIIIKEGKLFNGMLDGCGLLSLSGPYKKSEKIAQLLGDLFRPLRSKSIEAKVNKDILDVDVLEEVFKKQATDKKVTFRKNSRAGSSSDKVRLSADTAVFVEDEDSIKKLKDFCGRIKEINNLLMVSRDDSLTLSQGKLVDSMWGAGDMQKVLEQINQHILSCKVWEKVEFYSDMVLRSLERLLYKMQHGLSSINPEEKRIIYAVLIPNILDNFEEFKKAARQAFLVLSDLMHVDEEFKEKTTYPADWFLNGSMLKDLAGDFRKLTGFLLDLPRIEKEIIYPLDTLKFKFLNESVGQV